MLKKKSKYIRRTGRKSRTYKNKTKRTQKKKRTVRKFAKKVQNIMLKTLETKRV